MSRTLSSSLYPQKDILQTVFCPVGTIVSHEGCSKPAVIGCLASSCFLFPGMYYFGEFWKFETTKMYKEEPSICIRCCFPISSTYYHESNLINKKTILSVIFCCCYTVPFYYPTWSLNNNNSTDISDIQREEMFREEIYRDRPKSKLAPIYE